MVTKISSSHSCSIYFNETHFLKTAAQKIGHLWNSFQSLSPLSATNDQFKGLVNELGVSLSDTQAHQALAPLIQKILQENVVITASEENTGVYFLSIDNQKIAVFKVGEKRARMELLVRWVAHRLGLEKHAIPGLFCSLANPSFPQEEIIVELWNGNQKVFIGHEKDYHQEVCKDNFSLPTPYTLTGILEPFIDVDQGMTKEEFASMTFLSLIVGLRDGKQDGMKGATLFDTEECMPLFPSFEKNPNQLVASIYLPYLDHPFAKEKISFSQIKEFLAMLPDSSSWFQELTTEKIQYPDVCSEDLLTDQEEESRGWDHGGCPVLVETSPQILDQHSTVNLQETDQLLNSSQLQACFDRIMSLKKFLQNCLEIENQPTTIELVCAADPLYHAHLKALERKKNFRHSFASTIGRVSPKACDLSLSSEDVNALKAKNFPFFDFRNSAAKKNF